MIDKIIDGDEKKHWFLKEVNDENKKKVKKPEEIEYIEASRKKSSKSKPKNKRRKGCGCK